MTKEEFEIAGKALAKAVENDNPNEFENLVGTSSGATFIITAICSLLGQLEALTTNIVENWDDEAQESVDKIEQMVNREGVLEKMKQAFSANLFEL